MKARPEYFTSIPKAVRDEFQRRLLEMTPADHAEIEHAIDASCGVARPIEEYYERHGVTSDRTR